MTLVHMDDYTSDPTPAPMQNRAASNGATIDIAQQVFTLATNVCQTEFVPDALRGRRDAVAAAMLAGHELGLPPMQSLSQIHIIKGKPTLSAEMMRALVQSSGHEIAVVELTNTRCRVQGRRKGSTLEPTEISWSTDDAKKAGLLGNDNWRKYPRAMLAARATGELCRLIFADVLAGMSYTPEEMQDLEVVDASRDVGEVVDDTAEADDGKRTVKAPARKPASKKTAAKKKPAAKKPAPAPEPVVEPDVSAKSDDTGYEEPELPTYGDDDDEVVDAELVDDEPEPVKRELTPAQRFAMRCNDIGLDDNGRHRLVHTITDGRETSSNGLSDAEREAAMVMLATDGLEITVGTAGVSFLIDGEPMIWDPARLALIDPDDEPAHPAGAVTPEELRALARDKGVRVAALVKEAQELAGQLGVVELPGSPQDICEDQAVLAGVLEWLEGI